MSFRFFLMDFAEQRKRFPSKLKFWSVHCLINALPSYLIAVVWLQLWDQPVAQLAMGFAVLTFVIGYSIATSLPGPLSNRDSLAGRAMRVGLTVRTVISVITMLAVPLGPLLIFTPDLWCGVFASNVVGFFYQLAGLEITLQDGFEDGVSSGRLPGIGFMEVYLTTFIEGLILSFMLFLFSFIAILILQMRDRKKRFSQKPVSGRWPEK